MAAIDKTYVSSWEQWKEIRDWAEDKSFTLKNGKTIHVIDWVNTEMTKEDVENWLEEVRQSEIRWAKNSPESLKYWTEKYGEDWESHVKGEVVFWNTPMYLDLWLIKNCPLEIIQNRLKEQYGGGWSKEAFSEHSCSYEAIKAGTSVYDNFVRNGVGDDFVCKVLKQPTGRPIHKFYYRDHDGKRRIFIDKKCWWFVDVEPAYINWGEPGYEHWYYDEEMDYWATRDEAVDWTSSSASIKGITTKKAWLRRIKKWNLPAGTMVKVRSRFDGIEWVFVVKRKNKR